MVHYADSYTREGWETVIYIVYRDGEILVETDDLEYAKNYAKDNSDCSVRDARTGKKVQTE